MRTHPDHRVAAAATVQPADNKHLNAQKRKDTLMTRFFIDAKKITIGTEDAAEFEAIRDEIVKEHTPDGPTQTLLTEQIAVHVWRLRRAQHAESTVIKECDGDPGPLAKVSTYIKSIENSLYRAIRELAKMKAEHRKAASELARVEAARASAASDQLLERILGPIEMSHPPEVAPKSEASPKIDFVSQKSKAVSEMPAANSTNPAPPRPLARAA